MTQADPLHAGATAAEVLAPLWRQQLAGLRDAEVGVRMDAPDSVHAFRLAARRLRSSLSAFVDLVEPRAVVGLGSGLGEATRVVGGARDATVRLERLSRLLEGEPAGPGLEVVRRRLLTGLEAAQGTGREQVLAYLDTAGYDSLTRGLERFCDLPPWTAAAGLPAAVSLAPLLRLQWTRFRRASRRALAVPPGPVQDEHLHDARKAAKQVRYVGGPLVPVLGRRTRKLVKAATRAQGLLGDHQDSLLTRSVLEEALGEGSWTDDEAVVLTRLRDHELAAAAGLRAGFADLSRRLDGQSLGRRLPRR
jgi:CHAD domain-containing protein